MRFLFLTLLIPSMMAMVGCAGSCYNGGCSNYGIPAPRALGPFAMIAYANNLNTWQGDGCGEVYRNSWINNPPQEKPYDPCGRSLYPSEHYYQAKASNGYYRGVPVKKCNRGVSNGPCYCDRCLSAAGAMNSSTADANAVVMGTGVMGGTMEMGTMGMDGSMMAASSYPVDASTASWNGTPVWGDGSMVVGDGYTMGYGDAGNISYDTMPGTVISSGSGNPYASQNALGGTASPEYVAPLAPGPTVNRQAMVQSRQQFQASNTPSRLTPVQDPFRDQLRTLPQTPDASQMAARDTATNQMVATTNRPNQVVPVSGTVPMSNASWTASSLGNQTSNRAVARAGMIQAVGSASPNASVPPRAIQAGTTANRAMPMPQNSMPQNSINVGMQNTGVPNANAQNVDPSDPEYQTKIIASLPFDPQLQPGEYIVNVNWGPEMQSSMPTNGGSVQTIPQNGMMPTAPMNGQLQSLPQLQQMPTAQNAQSASARAFVR